MSELGPCSTCGTPYEECPVSDDDAVWTTDANGNHAGLCCEDCGHPAVSYRDMVNAPLSQSTVDALNTAIASGNYPVRQVKHDHAHERWTAMTPEQRAHHRGREGREVFRRQQWQERLREWLAASVSIVSYGRDRVWPIAPDRIPEDQRWANWFAYTEDDALNVALVRSYGCRCAHPLLGWTMKHDSVDGWEPTTPRCRTCNAESPD